MLDPRATVYVLSDNRLLREALSRILGKKPDLRIVGANAFRESIDKHIAALKPTILLSDGVILATSRCPLLGKLQSQMERPRVILVGMEADRAPFLSAVRSGVYGYVLRDASAAEVYSAVQSVAKGEATCPPQFLQWLFQAVAEVPEVAPHLLGKRRLSFTSRQQQLILLIGRGLTNKEIASQLNLSEQTIKNHVHRMLKKAGESHRLAIVERYAHLADSRRWDRPHWRCPVTRPANV
jgi:two-component system, NarL family, response regulator DevR